MKKSTFPVSIFSILAGLGCILYAAGFMLSRVNLAIPYLLAILSTALVQSKVVWEMRDEYKQSHTWKGNPKIRKDFLYFICMLIVNWVVIFIFLSIGPIHSIVG